MTYTTEYILQKAKEVIPKHRLIFIEDVCAMIGISKFTFYDKIKVDSNEYNELTKLLNENKIALKIGMRKKWSESDNPTLQMALYKLCSTDIEHKKLQQSYTDVTSDNKRIQTVDPFAQIRLNNGINTETKESD